MLQTKSFELRVVLTGLFLLAAMTTFEATKQALFPAIGIWESHVVTIVFSALAGAVFSWFVFRKFDQLHAELERRYEARAAELAAADRELESFSYAVSHNLGAPVRAISGIADTLAKHPSIAANPDIEGFVRRIDAAVVRLGQILEELVRYLKLGRQHIHATDFSLAAEVAAIAREIDRKHAGRAISWRIGPLPEVKADAALLRLALDALLDNAAKFTRPRPEAVIDVSARTAGSGIELAVRDNGVGFDMAHASHLYEPFQRLHHGHEFEGLGMGLTHARRIAERHGGRIWCEAAPDAGATFYFALPQGA